MTGRHATIVIMMAHDGVAAFGSNIVRTSSCQAIRDLPNHEVPTDQRYRGPRQDPDESGQIAPQRGQFQTHVVMSIECHRRHPPKLNALSLDGGPGAVVPAAPASE